MATSASLFADVRDDSPTFGAVVDKVALAADVLSMTATKVIQQIKTLPARERRKVIRYVVREAERREDEADRAALAEARRDPRPSIRWEDAKKRLGLK